MGREQPADRRRAVRALRCAVLGLAAGALLAGCSVDEQLAVRQADDGRLEVRLPACTDTDEPPLDEASLNEVRGSYRNEGDDVEVWAGEGLADTTTDGGRQLVLDVRVEELDPDATYWVSADDEAVLGPDLEFQVGDLPPDGAFLDADGAVYPPTEEGLAELDDELCGAADLPYWPIVLVGSVVVLGGVAISAAIYTVVRRARAGDGPAPG